MGAVMLIRFVVRVRDEDAHCLAGIFGAAYDLRDRRQLGEDEQRALEDLLRWFETHLPVPKRFSRSRRSRAQPKAVCWMKEGPGQHFDKVRDLATLLERHGVSTRSVRTDRPGYVVYEDEYQIVAEPFRDTGV
jgi:hypothetical protein